MKYSVFFRKLENFWILNFSVQRHQLISGYHLETLIVKPKSKSQYPIPTGPKVGPYPYPQLLTMNQPSPKDWPGGQQEQGHFPRFDLTAFVCDFPYMRPLKYDWESSWYRTGVVGGLHGWHELHTFPYCLSSSQDFCIACLSWFELIENPAELCTCVCSKVPTVLFFFAFLLFCSVSAKTCRNITILYIKFELLDN